MQVLVQGKGHPILRTMRISSPATTSEVQHLGRGLAPAGFTSLQVPLQHNARGSLHRTCCTE